MEYQNYGPGLYRPQIEEAETRSLSSDGTVSTVGFPNIDGQCQAIQMDDSQTVGVPVADAGDSIVREEETAAYAVEVRTEVKRKRGRPPRGQGKPPPAKKQKEEEDVCFICFDGGSLVLCDRRGCPKAYHPACIKRDEAFFRSKARWNCGWHICSVCQKAAHYMCYTCTYSLCKGCTKDADYLCVRGDKGFCNTCMRTVMLIENKEQGNQEMAQVDFDDKSSWEYLFKVYWIYLKDKLCLTLAELAQAKNPWKESSKMVFNGQSPVVLDGTNDVKSSNSESTSGQLEGNSSTRRKSNELLKILNEDTEKPGKGKDTSLTGCRDWATKELLDFVAHMKNGDTSVMSQFDVQALLLDYIKRNNLRDPRNKSHILCDLRLKTLFDKPRVGHFEMLKLLEFHFLIKEEPPKDVFVQGGLVDVNTIQVLADENNDNLMGKDRKRKTRKKGEERAPQTNLNEYAAIDVHNINLIYLRRSLMENLIEDKEKFHDNVVGSVVRIRISGGEQKQDMYRLVQVVGTTKVSVPYKISNRTADVMLEVLNLDKKEAVSIDAISNQDFSEDECRRLRQSIKCGLVKRFTVGEIQGKAMELQAVRLNDWLESEILRFNHLRDRASENGRKKELRECVEKLQLLKTPEERQRRLRKIPDVNCDPNMDPNYESDEDAGKLDNRKQDFAGEYVKPRYSGYNREGSKSISLKRKGDISGDTGSRVWNNSTPTYERSRNMCATSYPDKEESAAEALQKLREGKDACRPNISARPGKEADCTGLGIGNWNNQAVATSSTFSTIASETSTAPLSTGNTPSAYNSETKLWHYRDPNGKIQGPFCMVQLQKWSTTGYFPHDMRIWAGDRQDDSILLSDALNIGQFHKVLPLLNDISSQLREVGGASDGKLYNSDFGWGENVNVTTDVKQTEGHWHGNIVTVHSSSNNELVRSDRCGSHSSVWTSPVVSYKKEIPAGSCSQEQDSFKGNSSCYNQLRVHSPLSSSTLSGKEYATLSHHEKNAEVKRSNSDPDHENWNSHGTTGCKGTGGHILENHSNSRGVAGQSSGENWGHSPVNFSTNNLNLNPTFSVTKSTDSPDQYGEVNITNLHSSSRKTSNGDWETEAAENKESVSSSVHVQDSDIQDLPSPTPKRSYDYQKIHAVENQQSVSSNIPIQDSGPSWSSTSNLVVGKAQLADITDEWGGYSPTPVKHSVEEWDSSLISVSALKPTEVLCDQVATATSRSCELADFSPSHPASNLSSWQTSITEPIEFSTLAEESVSDLLAEVDAMESQCGLASPTSVMNCG